MPHTLVLLAALLCAAAASASGPVPPPFEPLRVESSPGAVEVALWGRRYRFAAGPLPVAVSSQGTSLLAAPPRLRVRLAKGEADVAWQPPAVVEAQPDFVRLRSEGTLPGLTLAAETRLEYDGMIAVELEVGASQATTLHGLSYELPLAPEWPRYYAYHLPYDAAAANVEKHRLLEAAGALPGQLGLDFVPTLALGDRRVGVEWWSETNAHWQPKAGTPAFEVVRTGPAVRLRVTPVASPLALSPGAPWRDGFALFVFPARPAPERWRSVRFLPYNRAAGFSSRIGTRFVFLAMQQNFHARFDGLPASIDDRFQREAREELDWNEVDYMPYGALLVAPLMHPTTLENLEAWSSDGRWWRLQPGSDNAVIKRNHPDAAPGTPYTYSVCAARQDYFDFILAENLRTLREERLDGLYFDHAAITRMCVRNPRLAGRPDRESWEYRNVRDFYKRLYEGTRAARPEALLVIHTHGTPKALGAFADFHMFGEALNGFFGGGRHASEYRANPDLYRPDYSILPEGHLDAQLHPRVGGVPSLIPQVKWAREPLEPARARAYQRAFQALVLSNDAHAPLWVSDLDTADEIYRAVDRFGDIGDAVVHPYWSNEAAIRRPEGLRATAWVRDDRALLVLANFGSETVFDRIELDLAALGVEGAKRVRDLERPEARRWKLEQGGFEVEVPSHDLRVLMVE